LSLEIVEGLKGFERGGFGFLVPGFRMVQHLSSECKLHHGLVNLLPIISDVELLIPVLRIPQLQPRNDGTYHGDLDRNTRCFELASGEALLGETNSWEEVYRTMGDTSDTVPERAACTARNCIDSSLSLETCINTVYYAYLVVSPRLTGDGGN
jgi:hypothetical protein